MWNKIEVQGGGTLSLQYSSASGHRTVIEDAQTGVYMDNNSIVNILQAAFYRNRVGIYMNQFKSSNYLISNNIFDFLNPSETDITGMKPSTSDATVPINSRPLAGIQLSNSTAIIPNPSSAYVIANSFQNINCGIFAYNSNLTSESNLFSYIKAYDVIPTGFTIFGVSPLQGSGKAVYSKAQAGTGIHPLAVKSGTTAAVQSSPVLFDHCDFGVYAEGVFPSIENNRMSGVANAVYTLHCYGDFDITGNYIEGTDCGVTLNTNYTSTGAIVNNTIYANEPVGLTITRDPITGMLRSQVFGRIRITFKSTYGIKQTAANALYGGVITFNHIFGGRTGILVENASTQIGLNFIHQNGNTNIFGSQDGIYTTNSSHLAIAGNTLDGNGNATYDNINSFTLSHNTKSGITCLACDDGLICSNTFGLNSAIGYGLNFGGNSPKTQFLKNNFHASRYGVVLQAVGTIVNIADQGNLNLSSSNLYYGTDGHGNFGGSNRTFCFGGGRTVLPKIYYLPNSGLNLEYPLPTASQGTTNVITPLSISGSEEAGCAGVFGLKRLNGNVGSMNPANEAVANGYADTLMISDFVTTGPWLAERNLYAMLCDTVQEVFSAHDVLPLKFDTLLMAYLDTVTDTVTYSVAADLHIKMNSLKHSMPPADTSLLDDTAFANFFVAKQYSDYNAMQQYIDQLKTLHDTALLTDTAAYDAAWASAKTLNDAIPDSNVQAANFKAVQSIYLRTIARSDTLLIDTSALSLLDSIAAQCPYVAGDAVYYARALYAQFIDTIFYDDVILCQPADTSANASERSYKLDKDKQPMKATEVKGFVKVYPNPAHQLINLAYYEPNDLAVEFVLFDQIGRKVLDEKLGEGQAYASYSTDNLSNGVYYWGVRGLNKMIKTGKIVIIK